MLQGKEISFPLPRMATSEHSQQRMYYLLKQMTFPKSVQELWAITGKKSVSITKQAVMMGTTIEYASKIIEFGEQAQCFDLYSSW